MIMLIGFPGFRTSAIVATNISDVNLVESLLGVHEKGYWEQVKKVIPWPHKSSRSPGCKLPGVCQDIGEWPIPTTMLISIPIFTPRI